MSSEKLNKYDRQLRLWASTGQSNLEQSHICLVKATSTGSEILKNLILPGVGQFTIIDSSIVTQDDVSGNFFLTSESIGQSRSQAMCGYLTELNHDTKGHFITDPVDSFYKWDQFDLVIISDGIDIKTFDRLRSYLYDSRIPLLVVNTVGYYGTVHLILNEVTVIETHTNRLYDLRIDQPWPQLQSYADTFDLDSLDDTDHAHVPAVIIFIKGLSIWKKTHDDVPRNTTQKREFKALIQSMSRDINFETNFIEAIDTIHRAYRKTEVPPYLLDLFSKPQLRYINEDTPFFWILIKALKMFVQTFNSIPVSGSLPDMASDTRNYISLQNIYKNKANVDRLELTSRVEAIVDENLHRSILPLEHDLIGAFCKNIQNLHFTEGNNRISNDDLLSHVTNDAGEYDNDQVNTVAIYYGLLVFNEFVAVHGRKPQLTDLDLFVDIFKTTYNIGNVPVSVLNVFKEVLCHNVQNYHNISSLIGGIASQEVLKLTTSQYVPLDNMLIFDGIRSITGRYKV